MTRDDLINLVKNTLTGSWNINMWPGGIHLDLYEEDYGRFLELKVQKHGKNLELTFIYYVKDVAYFNEEKSFDNIDDLIGSLEKVNHITNLTLDEILIETNYSELRGTYKHIL